MVYEPFANLFNIVARGGFSSSWTTYNIQMAFKLAKEPPWELRDHNARHNILQTIWLHLKEHSNPMAIMKRDHKKGTIMF